MFSRGLKPLLASFTVQNIKNFSATSQKNFKVVVAGASGGIGQPLALLLKGNLLIKHLALYDIVPVTHGVAVDLSHMGTPARVTGHEGPEEIVDAMKDADIVVIPAGVPRKPGMTRDDLFNTNAFVVGDLAVSIAYNSPKAIVAIITNPVNSMVPIASEVLKKAGVYDPKRVLGVTTLDVVRSAAFIGEINGVDPLSITIPVIGGHSGVTIIPVLSQSQPAVKLNDQTKIKALTERIQQAGTEVVTAKAGGGSATLSMAYAAARFTHSILRGLTGEANVVECAYIKSDVTEAPYFANPVVLGKHGVENNLGFGKLNEFEQQLLKAAIPELLKNIKVGEEFAKNFKLPPKP